MPKDIPSNFFNSAPPVAVIAGGAGFVGSHVCEALLAKSVKVVCVDNWQTGLKENVNHLLVNPNFILLEADINDGVPSELKKADYILHLAGIESYLNGEDVSIGILEANSIGSRNLLLFADKQKAKFLLASTINVFSAAIPTSNIKDYFGKSREEEGEFSRHEAKRFAEALTSEYGIKRNVDVRIVRLGDVYGPRMVLSTNNHIARLLKQALYGKDLEVSGKQEVVLYPVYISDVVEGIVKALFSVGTKNSIIAFTGPKTTLFSLAQKIKKSQRGGEIKFVDREFLNEGNIKEEVLHTGQKSISWNPKINPEEGLVLTLDWFSKNKRNFTATEDRGEGVKQRKGLVARLGEVVLSYKKEQSSKPQTISKGSEMTKSNFWNKDDKKEEKSKPTAKLSWFKNVYFVVFLILLGMFSLFFVAPLAFFGMGIIELTIAKESFLKGESVTAEGQFTQASSLFSTSEQGFLNWDKIPMFQTSSARFSKKSRILSRIADIGKNFTGNTELARNLFSNILSGDPTSSVIQVGEISLSTQDLLKRLAFLETEVGAGGVSVHIPFYKTISIVNSSTIGFWRRSLNFSSSLFPRLENILGKNQKQTYLILLQDNGELRPGGGLISSFVLATFERGRLINTETHDAYSADDQLKGHVDPPLPIKNYLGSSGWYLRDSNWSPDLPTSSQRATWFIDKELDQRVDGVVTIDLEFIKNFLGEVGGVKVDDFNETITKDNLYQKIYASKPSVAERNYNPNGLSASSGKDLLTSLSRQLISLIKNDPAKYFIPLAKTSSLALDSRHMSIIANDQKLNTDLGKLGWNGALRQDRCITINTCADDYLSVIEANLGTNKSNYFLDRSFSLELVVDKDKISHRLLISYKNRSQKDVGPGGDYKNYLRLFTQKGSKLAMAILVNVYTGQQDQLNFDSTQEKDKDVFGVLATIPAGEGRQLIFVWDTPIDTRKDLFLTWQKQQGTDDNPVSLRINGIAQTSKITVLDGPSLTGGGTVGYNTSLSRDLILIWQQKQ